MQMNRKHAVDKEVIDGSPATTQPQSLPFKHLLGLGAGASAAKAAKK